MAISRMFFHTVPVGLLSMNARSNQNLNILWLGSTDLGPNSRLKLSDVDLSQDANAFNNEIPSKLLHDINEQTGIIVQVIDDLDCQLLRTVEALTDAIIVYDQPSELWLEYVDRLPILFIREDENSQPSVSLPNITALRLDQSKEHTDSLINLWLDLCSTRKAYKQTHEQQQQIVLQRDDARLGLAMLGEQLVQLSEHDEQSSHIQERILALLSHEMRTPLNGIVGMTELLTQTQLTDEQSEEIQLIQCSAMRLANIVDRLLDYRTLTNAEISTVETDFDLYQCIENVTQMLQPQAIGTGLLLYDLIDPNTPQYVCGDSRILTKILTSLISNAIKFTPQGQVVVNVCCLPVLGDSDFLQIRIEDTGIGIEQENLQSIFEPFSQLEDYHTRHHEGLGLGLCMTQKLVQKIGGSIEIESEPEVGSHFIVNLPIRKISKQVHRGPSLWQLMQKTNILLWTNDNTLSYVLSRQGKQAGYQCTAVKTAGQIQSMLAQESFAYSHNQNILLIDTRIEKEHDPEEVKKVINSSTIPTASCSTLSNHLQNDSCPIDPAQPWDCQYVFDFMQIHFMQMISNLCHPGSLNHQRNQYPNPSKYGAFTS
jgi:signal transduction histidine kinase